MSKNMISFVGITSHWIDDDWKLNLDFRPLKVFRAAYCSIALHISFM